MHGTRNHGHHRRGPGWDAPAAPMYWGWSPANGQMEMMDLRGYLDAMRAAYDQALDDLYDRLVAVPGYMGPGGQPFTIPLPPPPYGGRRRAKGRRHHGHHDHHDHHDHGGCGDDDHGCGGCDDRPQPAPLPSCFMAPRRIFDVIGPLQGNADTAFVDWYLRAREAGMSFHYVPEVVARRRIHGANRSYRNGELRREYVRTLKASLDRRRRDRIG